MRPSNAASLIAPGDVGSSTWRRSFSYVEFLPALQLTSSPVPVKSVSAAIASVATCHTKLPPDRTQQAFGVAGIVETPLAGQEQRKRRMPPDRRQSGSPGGALLGRVDRRHDQDRRELLIPPEKWFSRS